MILLMKMLTMMRMRMQKRRFKPHVYIPNQSSIINHQIQQSTLSSMMQIFTFPPPKSENHDMFSHVQYNCCSTPRGKRHLGTNWYGGRLRNKHIVVVYASAITLLFRSMERREAHCFGLIWVNLGLCNSIESGPLLLRTLR